MCLLPQPLFNFSKNKLYLLFFCRNFFSWKLYLLKKKKGIPGAFIKCSVDDKLLRGQDPPHSSLCPHSQHRVVYACWKPQWNCFLHSLRSFKFSPHCWAQWAQGYCLNIKKNTANLKHTSGFWTMVMPASLWSFSSLFGLLAKIEYIMLFFLLG